MTTAARACPACHTPLPVEAHFCLHCGTPTPTEPGVPPRTTTTAPTEIARVQKALAGRGYSVESVLGEGGMATVYLATDVKHRRKVAVKVMRPELAATLGADRFLREVEIAAQLSHPHILPVHDSGDANGVLFYVMPFVEGESLHDRLRKDTQLPVEEALRIAREVSEALAYAHSRKIVHRDIKPANIMLSAGHALVADFGIARAVGTGSAITQTGFAVGTPQYMSPEQASGSAAVDARSDIFAVGCVAYEMLAGEPPFSGPTPQAIITRSLTEAPRSLMSTREGVSPAVEAVVNRALTKNPADRWQSAADFAAALRGAEDQLRLGVVSGGYSSAATVTPSGETSAGKAWALFGVTGVIALLLIFGLVRRLGLPVWSIGAAVLLLAIGAVVLFATGRMEARRRAGIPVRGLAASLTWRNAALGGVAALGLWAVAATTLAMRGTGRAASAGGVVRLAVLPFENRGSPEDAYFVDGVADQVRGKLMNLAGFQVIARASSDQYKGTSKTPQQIGRELDVNYLLTSTVTWIKSSDGTSRVQVVPELIDVKTGAGKWQESFDAQLTDIFQVQGTIATQVAGALNVALAPSEEQELAERPTQSLAAYDQFLKGKAVLGNAPADLRRKVAFYEQAVSLDSTFAEAWSQMAFSTAQLYFNGTPDPEVAARGRRAVDHVRALAPGSAPALVASARYKYLVVNDVAGAVQDAMAALAAAPNDADALRLASTTEMVAGKWDEALLHAEAAVRVDPRSQGTQTALANVLLLRRQYGRVIPLLRAQLAESPTLNSLETLAAAFLMQGLLDSARAAIRPTPAGIDRRDLVAYFGLYQDLYWVLEDQDQRLLLSLGPDAFDNDRASWASTLMQLAALRGDRARARTLADTARREYEKQLESVPNDPQRNIFYGMTLAVLGRKEEAIARAVRGAGYLPLEKDQNNGSYMQHQLARVYLLTGENEKALDVIEQVAKVPYVLTPQWLRIDPNFAPLRGHPRFERLLTER